MTDESGRVLLAQSTLPTCTCGHYASDHPPGERCERCECERLVLVEQAQETSGAVRGGAERSPGVPTTPAF
jgi:hypothetical protein